MTIRSLFAVLALLASIQLFGCVWPWPSATEDTRGLGKSEIARILKNICCAPSEGQISEKIQIALRKASQDHGPRDAAESIGFTCEEAPSKACRYTGEMTYQVHGAPKENMDAQKVHSVSYSIVLPSYENPREIHAERKTIVLP